MASDSDFSGNEQFMEDDNLSLVDPGEDSMSEASFTSSDSWDPMDVRESDSDYNEISDLEDLEFISDDSTVSNDPDARTPVVDPVSEFNFVSAGNDKRPTPDFPFTNLPAGYNPSLPTFDSPMESFMSFIDDEIVESLVFWTNERAEQYFESRVNTIVNGIKWKPVDIDTMYIFLALVMNMGVVREPEISNYWSKHPQYGGPAIFNSKVMSRNYFMNILKFIRFSSVDQVNKKDQRTRIEPFLELLREKCKNNVNPGEHIAVDEALILWKGRLKFRQFIKTKRSRFGIKVFLACPGDKKYYGYSWDFQVYYGKQSNFKTDQSRAADPPLSITEEIVVKMLSELLGCGVHVITDNWYTSLRLANFLLQHETDITGIVNPQRGPAKVLRDAPVTLKGSQFARKGDVLITKYQDRKTIYALTTK